MKSKKYKDRILNEFELEDESVSSKKQVKEVIEDSDVDISLEGIEDTELPTDPNAETKLPQKAEGILNLQAIQSASTDNKEDIYIDDDILVDITDDEEADNNSEDYDVDLFEEDDITSQEPNNTNEAEAVKNVIAEYIEENLETEDVKDIDVTLDEYDEDDTNVKNNDIEKLGGSEALEDNKSETKVQVEEEPSEDNEVYSSIESTLLETAKALKDIKTHKNERDELKSERLATTLTTLSDEELELINASIDIEQIKHVEAKIYKVPDDIKEVYISLNPSLDRIENIIQQKSLDIEHMLNEVAEEVSPTTLLLVNRRYVNNALMQELTTTGKHYVVVEKDRFFPASLPANVEIIERDGVKYYSYITIPESYVGYRKPLNTFVDNLKKAIQTDLVEHNRIELSLIDDNNINILTVSEFRLIISLLDKLDLYHKVEDNKLVVTC